MQLHSLTRKTPNKKARYVARGGKRGKTAGRGTKGQSARAGNKKRPEVRDIIKRIPKLRGRGKNSFKSIETKPAVVNLGAIDAMFTAGAVVSPESLLAMKIVRRSGGIAPRVKILGNGDMTKKLTFKNVVVSGSAKEKIEKAGGAIVA